MARHEVWSGDIYAKLAEESSGWRKSFEQKFQGSKFTLLRKTREKIVKRHSNMVIRPDEDGTTSEKPTSEYHLSVITGGQHEQYKRDIS